MEHGFKERIPKAANPLWSDPIAECGNAEGAKLRFICGDEYTSKRVRLKRTRLEIPHPRPEVIGQVGFKPLKANLVDARGATVRLDCREGLKHEPVGDASREGVGFDDLGPEQSPASLPPSASPCRYWECFLA